MLPSTPLGAGPADPTAVLARNAHVGRHFAAALLLLTACSNTPAEPKPAAPGAAPPGHHVLAGGEIPGVGYIDGQRVEPR